MKTELTRQQSSRLIELGVSADKASDRALDCNDINNTKLPLEYRPTLPIFTLADVMALLPKKIYGFQLDICALADGWQASYALFDSDDDWLCVIRDAKYVCCRTELIDALYELLAWTIRFKYYQQ